MSMNGPREPAAAMRVAAATVREMYIALIHEGFTEDQALRVVGHILEASKPQ